MKIEKIGQNIYYMIDELFFDVVVGAVALPTKLVMIDTGTNLRKLKEFRKYVEEDSKKKFEYALITHYHGDHIIGNQIFDDCKIISSKWTYDRIQKGLPNWTPEAIEGHKKRIDDPLALEGFVITPPTDSFQDVMEITDGDEKMIFKQTGGHTKGSSYIYYPKGKALFGGDNLFIGSYPWGGEESCNPDEWISTYKEFLEMDIDHFIPGHGPVCDKKEIKFLLDYLELVKSTVKEMTKEGASEEAILEKCYKVPYYPFDESEEDSVSSKKTTLKKWYSVWTNTN